MVKTFEKNTFSKRLKSMLAVDFTRMFTTPFFYIMLGISLVIPILILVMTTMMDGSVSVNPQTGVASEPMEGFDNVWQIIGEISGNSANAGMNMSLVSMCNINLLYFAIIVLTSIFVADDFRSGYSKNLFTVRAKKTDYVISKTVVCFVSSALMFIAFFIGSIIGGKIAGLPFEMVGFNAGNVILSLLSKILLGLAFVALCLLASVIGKQKSWLSMIVSFGMGMLLFTMIPMITPINSTVINLLLCTVGGLAFSFLFGAVSDHVLSKSSLV